MSDILKKKIAVIGSREFYDKDWVFRVLDKNREKISYIVSGGCKNSADEIAHEWCKKTGVPIIIYYAAWSDTPNGEVNRAAGFERNKYIIQEADIVLAWWNGTSSGTKDGLDFAKTINKPVKIFNIKK